MTFAILGKLQGQPASFRADRGFGHHFGQQIIKTAHGSHHDEIMNRQGFFEILDLGHHSCSVSGDREQADQSRPLLLILSFRNGQASQSKPLPERMTRLGKPGDRPFISKDGRGMKPLPKNQSGITLKLQALIHA